MSDYLVKNYSLNQLQFSKPKKHGEYLVSKVKYSDEPFFIQFPKMKIIEITPKGIELEFLNNETKYNKEAYNFLSELDSFLSDQISEKSEDWFGKKIPLENVKNMYNNFIKAPKSTEKESTMNFSIKKDVTFIDHRKNDIDISEIKINQEIESISQLKYIMFSKDNCFTVWELQSAKIRKTVDKVKEYGFIKVEESDSEDEETISEIINFF
jgi:hypothetical protein